jgi:hypothetical protein
MKQLPFIEGLRSGVLKGSHMAPCFKVTAVSRVADENDRPLADKGDVMFRVETELFFNQRISVEQAGNPVARDHARTRGVRAIANLLYGPVEQEIREVIELLWQEGLGDHEATKKLFELIDTMRGERT